MPNPPKPPKGDKYGAASNDWMAGQMEAEKESDYVADNTPRRGAGRGPLSRNGMRPKKYAKGGGIEIRGKTKGRFV